MINSDTNLVMNDFTVCRLWTPIDGEFDDYIVNPKPSGYQVKILSLFLHSCIVFLIKFFEQNIILICLPILIPFHDLSHCILQYKVLTALL